MIYVLLLVAVTAVWGWTFVLVKEAISQYPTVPFLAIRFAVALAVLALAVRRRPSARVLRVGALIGLTVAAGYLTQTVGLALTSPGVAGLLTGLFVVFTPLLELALGRAVPPRTGVAVVLALAGTALLTGGAGGGSALGDGLVVAAALCFALQIVLLGRWAPGLPPAQLAMVQMGTAAVVFSALGSTQIRVPGGGVWFAILVTGVLASALAFFAQTWAQTHLSPSRTALILSLEPAWALLFAVLLAGQRLDAAQGAGAALVLAAIVGHEAAGLRRLGPRPGGSARPA
ncbi:MAG: DMT family transporter [Candidatus Dormibacterales bacterium]